MSEQDDFERGSYRRSDRHRTGGRPPARAGARPPASGRRRTPPQIDRVQPRSGSAETVRESQRRRRASSRIVTPEVRRRRRRRTLTIAALVVGAMVLGCVGWAWAFIANIDRNIHAIDGSSIASAIGTDTPVPAPGKPFYMVIMGVDMRPGETVSRSDSLMVAYVDPGRKRVTTMSIPRDTRVTIPDHGKTKINAAMQLGGPALVIKTVKQFTGLPITHYAYINFDGFKDMVDAVGGVDIYVPVHIYDRQAAGGTLNADIPKGWQHLDGGHALTFVRARHQFADQDFSRMKHQQEFLKALAKQAMTMTNPFRLPGLAAAVSRNVQTDLSLSEITSLALNLRGMKESDLQSVTMPGESKMINGLSYVVADETQLHEFLIKMKNGEQFEPVQHAAEPSVTISPSMITLTIRNGAGVSGLAKTVADKMTADGFNVKDTGNMGQYVYGKTMIVYRSDADSAKAIFVQDTIGVGNLVPSRGMYAFSGDLMIIIGKDFDPKRFGTTPTTRR